MVEDRRNYSKMADITNFLANTEGHVESEAAPIAGGDRAAHHQPGLWGEVRLHRALQIHMLSVGTCRMELATAAFGPLQPPSVGKD